MDYTTHRSRLILPEYGRNVQQMIDHALTIEDREERTRCVYTIIEIMGNLFPYLRDINDFKHKLWDHIAIMSDFKLDIDYPYEIIKKEELEERPEKIEYQRSKIRYLHYGRNLEKMIEEAGDYPEGEERDKLIHLIANQMKKCFLTWNKEIVNNQKIFDDLRELSNGKINASPETLRLFDSRSFPNNRKLQRNAKRGHHS